MEDKKEGPAQAGKCLGYQVEYKNRDGIWKPLHFSKSKHGVPLPITTAPQLSMMGLLGKEQALALAWWWKAEKRGGDLKGVIESMRKIRIVPYEIEYSVESYRQEEDAFIVEHK